MEQIKHVLGLILILIYLIHVYATVENTGNNEVRSKRVRRIIRGHLAQPGQVTNIFNRLLKLW